MSKGLLAEFQTACICVLQWQFPNSSYPTYIIDNTPTQATLQRILWPSPGDVSNVSVEWQHVFLLCKLVINWAMSDNDADLKVLTVYRKKNYLWILKTLLEG
jgi:hypothetical protein